MKLYKHWIILAALFLSGPSPALTPEQWREDIQELVKLVDQNHPNPFAKTSSDAFHQRVNQLLANVPELEDKQIVLQMMSLLASIRDGHSTLHPVDPAGFNRWLPLSFYWFEDGVYIVSAHKKYANLIGARVLRIGNADVKNTLSQVTPLIGSDNTSGDRQNIFYLSSVDTLAALGVIVNTDIVTIKIVDSGGRESQVDIHPVKSEFVLNETRFWGEMYGPVERDILADFVMPFNSLNLLDFNRIKADEKSDLPLHVRHRQAYWSHYLADQRTYYMQLNHVTSGGRGDYESFQAFYNDAFAFIDANPIDKFVLDIRYNSGGDGSILIPFVHKFIRSDKANKKGRLFTITGRKTYSAATMLVDLMLKHTNTVLVGEPAGSALNGYGDPRSYTLTNSGLSLDLSSEYWKLVHTEDSPPQIPIEIPAVFSGKDYFTGQDPAIDKILAIEGAFKSLDEVLAADGATAAQKRYDIEKQTQAKYKWWRPFDESTFRKVARKLGDNGQFEDSKIGFEILVDVYPDSWRAWRDYGKLNLKNNQINEAKRCLLRAAKINPGDSEVNELIDAMQ